MREKGYEYFFKVSVSSAFDRNRQAENNNKKRQRNA
jgi:hypothetical protein